MKTSSTKRKRPGVLVRFYPEDLAKLNKHCADACTPRENFVRRLVLQSLAKPKKRVAKKTAAA